MSDNATVFTTSDLTACCQQFDSILVNVQQDLRPPGQLLVSITMEHKLRNILTSADTTYLVRIINNSVKCPYSSWSCFLYVWHIHKQACHTNSMLQHSCEHRRENKMKLSLFQVELKEASTFPCGSAFIGLIIWAWCQKSVHPPQTDKLPLWAAHLFISTALLKHRHKYFLLE